MKRSNIFSEGKPMLLYELLDYINDSSIVCLYNYNHDRIAFYDGKESIPEKFNESEVWDIFGDVYKTAWIPEIAAIGIEIDTTEKE